MTARARARQAIVVAAIAALAAASDASVLGFNLSGQNEIRYGNGRQPNRPGEKLHYLENYFELTAGLDRWRFYLRQAYRLPSEYDIRTSGLDAFDKIYAEYRTDHLTLRGGDFYRTWGKGLLFSNQELRDVNVDTGLEGVLLEGNVGGFEGAAFRGAESYFNDQNESKRLEIAEGVWVSQRTPFDGRIGAGYINIDEEDLIRFTRQIDRGGVELEKDFPAGSFYGVYVADRLPANYEEVGSTTRKSRFKHALFTAGTIYGSGWSLYLDYRNYAMLIIPDTKPVIGQVVQPLLQNPPIGRAENTLYLFDHKPPFIRYDDDIGYQAELTANPEPFDLLVNYSLSSRADESAAFARIDNRHSPIEMLFVKGEFAASSDARLGLKGGWQRWVDYGEGFEKEMTRRAALGVIFDALLEGNFAVSGEAQAMEVNHRLALGVDQMVFVDKHWEEYLSLTVAHGGKVSLTGSFLRSENRGRGDGGVRWGRDFIGGHGWYWPSGTLAVQIHEQHQLRLFYGYEPGGTSCAGGVCHIVNPFKGVKFTLTSHF